MAQRSTDLPAIEAEIERIRSLGLDALRARCSSRCRLTKEETMPCVTPVI